MTTLPKTPFQFIIHFIAKYKLYIFYMLIFHQGVMIDNVFWPTLLKKLIEAIEGFSGPKNEIWGTISNLVWICAGIWLLIEFFFRTAFILNLKLLPKIEADIRMALFNYVSQQSFKYFSNNFTGSLANKINDMPRSVSQIINMILSIFLPVITTALILTIVVAKIYLAFGILIFIWFCMHVGVCLLTAKTCSNYADKHAESRSILSGRIVDSFANSISVRLFARRKFEHDYIMQQQTDEVNKQQQSLWYIEKVKILLGLICFIMIGVALTLFQVHAYKLELITLAELIFTMQAGFHITTLTWWAGLEVPRFFQEIGVCQQALSLVASPLEVVDKPNAKPINISRGEISFEDVTFRYRKEINIFEKLSVTILPGQKVGLVGFSGSGKTTFINLLLRHFDINDGRILIDGQDIAKVSQDSLREQISVIPQEPMLFHRTLMDNIRYGNVEATDEEVIAASKQAHCHEFIMKLKNGYYTVAGERGLKISGGQRQRIAIARAILRHTKILIMDEATSALDSLTERKIQDSLAEISQHCTTLVVAHRLSTLTDMDRVLVFKEGKIVEDGSHDELIAKEDGHYRELWEMQSNGFMPEEDEDEDDDEV